MDKPGERKLLAISTPLTPVVIEMIKTKQVKDLEDAKE